MPTVPQGTIILLCQAIVTQYNRSYQPHLPWVYRMIEDGPKLPTQEQNPAWKPLINTLTTMDYDCFQQYLLGQVNNPQSPLFGIPQNNLEPILERVLYGPRSAEKEHSTATLPASAPALTPASTTSTEIAIAAIV